MSTKKAVSEWEPQIERIVEQAVQKVKRDLKTERKCDVMKWWTFISSDVVGEIAFGKSFDNIEREEVGGLLVDKVVCLQD